MIGPKAVFAALWLSILGHTLAFSQLAGQPSNNPLVIVNSGQSTAMILMRTGRSTRQRCTLLRSCVSTAGDRAKK